MDRLMEFTCRIGRFCCTGQEKMLWRSNKMGIILRIGEYPGVARRWLSIGPWHDRLWPVVVQRFRESLLDSVYQLLVSFEFWQNANSDYYFGDSRLSTWT